MSCLQLDSSDSGPEQHWPCTALEADAHGKQLWAILKPQGGGIMSSSKLHEVDGYIATEQLHFGMCSR